MKVFLNSITGIEDAILSMYFSKRTWSPNKQKDLLELCRENLTCSGELTEIMPESRERFEKEFSKMLNISRMHTTLGRFIDFSFSVEGLHRGATDDLDAHACRFNNRIVRSSTRLATFGDDEKSDYYKTKIITTDEYLKQAGIELPNVVKNDGRVFIKAVNGYVQADCVENKDILRGLYMLSIPSNFIFKCNMTDFVHVYNMRNRYSHANPELQQCIEQCMDLIEQTHSAICREYFAEYQMY